MKRLLFFILLYSCITYNGYSQTLDFKEYINSFKYERTSDIIEFRKISKKGIQMSKEEALAFVYNGDTAKLYCIQKTINMETEEISHVKQFIFLPNKCMKIDMGEYFLIAYTSFECFNDLTTSLFLTIIDKTYRIKDNLLVYRGNDYDSDFHGLLNPLNGNIFLYGNITEASNRQAIIYKINDSNMKFEIIALENDAFGSFDYLIQTLEKLGLKETFMK